LRATLKQALHELALLTPQEIISERYAKFRSFGNAFVEEA
jgi:hypothetical protein